jgi:hypothetical protein
MVLVVWLAILPAAWAGSPPGEPVDSCDQAATVAEATWQLPAGLLSAIGVVESGRGDLARARPVPWPWTINFDGRGYFLPNKTEAVAVVSTVRAAGRAVIDVGCFQVNLFYHPEAFASIEEAFDPNANAQAAARILTRAHSGGGSWDYAIGLYHSASPDRAAAYLRQVQAVWPWVRTRGTMVDPSYAAVLSSMVRPIVVMRAADVPVSHAEGLPRILGPQTATGVLQWSAAPPGSLPVVLMPPPSLGHRAPARRFMN